MAKSTFPPNITRSRRGFLWSVLAEVAAQIPAPTRHRTSFPNPLFLKAPTARNPALSIISVVLWNAREHGKHRGTNPQPVPP